MTADSHTAIEAVWRLESPKLIAGLMRLVRDVGAAEDLAHDALVAALEQWPASGVPRNPGAWLMQAAKHRAIDLLRRRTRLDRKHDELARELDEGARLANRAPEDALDDDIGDDLLRLMFIACHPVLSGEARVALTLRLLGGLTTDEIARAYLVPEPTIAQRIVRAKKTLAKNRVPFEVPAPAERMVRLASLLEVIYLVFNEGFAATAGEDWIRPSLCEEALRLGRVLATLVPAEAEAHGLVALMELHASRFRARLGPRGEAILLLDHDRGRWDRLLIGRGLAALDRVIALDGGGGFYALQAGIAACHARARRRRRPTGRASHRSTPGSPASRDRRSCVSTMRWRWAGPTVLRPVWRSSTPWPRIRRWRRIPTCRARAAICWNAWAGWRRRAPNSFVPPP